MITEQEKQAAVQMLKAVAEAIRELGRVPSGHLYAQLMGFLSLDQYTKAIDILKQMGLVEEKYHELIWIG